MSTEALLKEKNDVFCVGELVTCTEKNKEEIRPLGVVVSYIGISEGRPTYKVYWIDEQASGIVDEMYSSEIRLL